MQNDKFKIKLSSLTDWLLIIGLATPVFTEAAIIFLVCILIYYQNRCLRINLNLLVGFGLLFFTSLVSLSVVRYSPFKFLQQFILLFYYYNAYYLIFSHHNKQIGALFSIYLKYVTFICILACIQFVIYFFLRINLFGFIKNNPLSIPTVLPGILRVSSIMTEPSQLSLFLTPAFGYYLFSIKPFRYDLWKRLIVATTIFLTFSTMTYVIIVIMVIYKYLVLKKSIVLRVLALLLTAIIVTNLIVTDTLGVEKNKNAFSSITMKISESIEGIKNFDPKSFELLNLSSYATLTNLWVALNAPNRLTGTGLGTHEQNYEATYKSDFKYYGLNKQEGFSIGNRLYSEFGLIGLFLLFVFVFKFYNKENPINLGALFYILTIFIRGGHYTRYGLVFFIFLYIYTSRYYDRSDSNESYYY